MKWSRFRGRLTPSFLKKKNEDKPISKGFNYLLYEFTIDHSEKLNVNQIRKLILMNPWSLAVNPSITFEDKQVVISFHVLSKGKGKEIENIISEKLNS